MTFTDPAKLFEAAVQALRVEDYDAVASLCDPVSLRAFRRSCMEQFANERAPIAISVEDYVRHQPEMPREVAEYQIAQIRRQSDMRERLRMDYPEVNSVDELRELTPTALFAAWMRGRSPRRQIQWFIDQGRADVAAIGAASSMSAQWYDYVLLGVLMDGTDVAHIVYRQRVDENEPWTGEMATMMSALPDDEQKWQRESWARGMPRFARCRLQADNSWLLNAEHMMLGVGNASIGGIGPNTDANEAGNSESS